MTKNVRNYNGGDGLGINTSNRRLYNLLGKHDDNPITMTASVGGYGIHWDKVGTDTGTTVGDITTYPTQKDSAYYTIYSDSTFESDATVCRIITAGWYIMDCTVVLDDYAGASTQNFCLGFKRRFNGLGPGSDEVILLGGTAVISEPVADGIALNCNGLYQFESGDIVRVFFSSSVDVAVVQSSAGGLGCISYWKITKL